MFGFQSALGFSQRTDPRQDSTSSLGSRVSDDGKVADLTSRTSSTLGFLSRSSKRLNVEPFFALSCEVAIRPSFCWNSHQDIWQTTGVWSQFDSGLKCCQDDVYACTNFMGHQDAAFAGVFDGHGFNGRSAATYARKNITKWLSVDGNAASKDPKRRLKALESVCGQIDRGLARAELCSFDASSSGLTACFGILQGKQICLATLGKCKAVVGRADSHSSDPKAVDLTVPEGMQPRATSETLTPKGKGHGMRRLNSMPMPVPFAEASPSSLEMPESFLGRGQLGERPSTLPLMTMHQLGSHDQFVVLASSGLWEVMTPQEAVDFVHQCRLCRPDNISCSEALTLEAHTRWKLNFSKVIAEDVAAVIINCGPMPEQAQPSHSLPAFPEAAPTNHDANDDHILHETREFWGRLQPQSLVPLLQTASSKGKGRMPSSLLPIPHLSPSSKPVHPHRNSSNPGSGNFGLNADRLCRTSSQSNPTDSGDAGPRDGILLTSSTYCGPRDHQDGSNHSSRDTTAGSRTVHFDLPSSSDSSGDDDSRQASGEMLHKSQDLYEDHSSTMVANRIRKKSPPVDISFRPDTPDVSSDHPCNVKSFGHSITSDLSNESSDMGKSKACSPRNSSQGLDKPSTNPEQARSNPFQAAAMTAAMKPSPDLSSDEDFESSAPFTSRPSTGPPFKSPGRAHAQQPLEEEGFQAAMLSIAKLSMMERTHSAPGGVPFGMLLDLPGMNRPRRRLPVSIPEDRAVASTIPADDAEVVDRRIHKIYPHGCEDESDLETLVVGNAQLEPHTLTSRRLGRAKSLNPKAYKPAAESQGRVHSKVYPTTTQLLSKAKLPRVQFPRTYAPVTSAPLWDVDNMEAQIRGGLPKVLSHPDNLADLASVAALPEAITSPFARLGLGRMSPQNFSQGSPPSPHQPLTDTTSGSNTGSVDPWASPSQAGGLLLLNSNSKRAGSTVRGRRNRNSSAAFEELAKLRGAYAP
ncbi:hypothetical protein WJX77_004133 [Trebouxia sp. C0004]